MESTKQTMKVWEKTRKKLKRLALELDMTMTALLDKLVDEAVKKFEEGKR